MIHGYPGLAMYTTNQAYQAGQWAAEAGRPLSAKPSYGPTPECAANRKAWEDGWNDAMKRMGRK